MILFYTTMKHTDHKHGSYSNTHSEQCCSHQPNLAPCQHPCLTAQWLAQKVMIWPVPLRNSTQFSFSCYTTIAPILWKVQFHTLYLMVQNYSTVLVHSFFTAWGAERSRRPSFLPTSWVCPWWVVPGLPLCFPSQVRHCPMTHTQGSCTACTSLWIAADRDSVCQWASAIRWAWGKWQNLCHWLVTFYCQQSDWNWSYPRMHCEGEVPEDMLPWRAECMGRHPQEETEGTQIKSIYSSVQFAFASVILKHVCVGGGGGV